MKLDSLKIEGFRSIKSLDLPLRNLNVIIGANGSGKSNLLNFFDMMKAATEGKFGSFVITAGGADRLLHFGQKQTDRISITMHFGSYVYQCTLKPKHGDSLFFEIERTYDTSKPEPSVGKTVRHELSESILYEATDSEVTKNIADAIASWCVYHFHDTSNSAKIRKTCDIEDNRFLRPDGSNIAACLRILKLNHREHYDQIVRTIRLVAPFFHDFILEPRRENKKTIWLRWTHSKYDQKFDISTLSDGTLRFICLATLLLQPDPPATIIIDEPELGLHPYAISLLAEMFQSASVNSQLIISTQSVTLVNQFNYPEIIVVDLEDGASKFRRFQLGDLNDWLDDYGLGDLWEKNILGGRPG